MSVLLITPYRLSVGTQDGCCRRLTTATRAPKRPPHDTRHNPRDRKSATGARPRGVQCFSCSVYE